VGNPVNGETGGGGGSGIAADEGLEISSDPAEVGDIERSELEPGTPADAGSAADDGVNGTLLEWDSTVIGSAYTSRIRASTRSTCPLRPITATASPTYDAR
jgi:hypothetical protein